MKRKVMIGSLVIAVIILTLVMVAGCKREEAPAAAAKVEKMLVGMATDVGGLGDQSFNDGAYQGLLIGKDKFGIDPRVIESKQQTDYVPNLSGLAEDGAALAFAVGFLMEDAVIEAAKMNPDTYYGGIDIWVNPDTAPKNLVGILYKEEESGFLAGVVAGLMTREHAGAIPGKLRADRNVVGVVLGMLIPPVEKFEVGFIQGVKYVNPDCQVLSVTTGSFVDQAKGKESAEAMIDQGADIIFHAAGLTGLGAIQAARERGVLAIGVDVDQNHVAPDTVLTSAFKAISESVALVIEDVFNGTFEGGRNIVYGIQENATGIAPFNQFESQIPQAVKDKIREVTEDMKAGRIKIETTRGAIGL